MARRGFIQQTHLIWPVVMLLALLAGCQTSEKGNHEKWVDQANNRWHRMRSSLMLDMAKQHFRSGDLEQAKKSVRQGLQIDPGHAKLQVLAGRIALERNKLERAYHLFSGAIKSDKKLAAPHYYQGVVLQRWQDFKQAKASYERAYERKKDNVSYLIAMSEMLAQQDRIDEAIELLAGKQQYFDQNSTLRVALAHLHSMKEQYVKAAALFKEASLLDPDNAQITRELGLAQIAAGEHEQAVHTLKSALRGLEVSQRPGLRRALARAQAHTGRLDAARRTYLELARSEAGEARDWVSLGELAFEAEDLSGTLHAAQRAQAKAPQNPEGYLLAGLVLQERGKLNEAIAMFDRAAEAAPDRANPLILRGLSLERAGRRAEAADAYRRALNRAPNDSRAKRLLSSVTETRS